jgi:hypothetical protein
MDRLLDDNVMPSKAAIVASFLKTRACAGRKEYWESLTVVGPRAGALRALHVDLHRSPTLSLRQANGVIHEAAAYRVVG